MQLSQVLVLLQMAMSLLVSVQTPGTPIAVRDQATSFANQVLTIALDEVKGLQAQITPSVPPPVAVGVSAPENPVVSNPAPLCVENPIAHGTSTIRYNDMLINFTYADGCHTADEILKLPLPVYYVRTLIDGRRYTSNTWPLSQTIGVDYRVYPPTYTPKDWEFFGSVDKYTIKGDFLSDPLSQSELTGYWTFHIGSTTTQIPITINP